MNLHEYQSKKIFSQHGIPVPMGRVAETPAEAREICEELGGKAVIKSQVLAGGRGKAGGIKLAHSPEEAETLASQILGMKIKNLPVRKVLVDPISDIKTEIYLGITNDRAARKPLMMASGAGGMDIEEVARTTPEKIVKTHIDPLLGLHEYQARDMALGIDLPREHWNAFVQIAQGLWQAFQKNDATLAEINPLVITGDNRLLGLDGKMSIDDNGLYRHPELEVLRDLDAEDEKETLAREHDLSYIKLDGSIGCMVNGAGLAMTTLDIIKMYGGEAANFLDIGGGANAQRVETAFRLLLSDPNVKAVMVNIFGGITRCDDVARGILSAMQHVEVKVPMVVRLGGTKAKEGRELLAAAHIPTMQTADTLTEAAEKAVAAAKGA